LFCNRQPVNVGTIRKRACTDTPTDTDEDARLPCADFDAIGRMFVNDIKQQRLRLYFRKTELWYTMQRAPQSDELLCTRRTDAAHRAI
jgi:hypothetical protein